MQLSAVVASEELRQESHAGSHAGSNASRSGQPVSPHGVPSGFLSLFVSVLEESCDAKREVRLTRNQCLMCIFTILHQNWCAAVATTVNTWLNGAADLVEVNSGGSVHFCFFEPAALRCRMAFASSPRHGHHGPAAVADTSPPRPRCTDRPASADAPQTPHERGDLRQNPPSGGAPLTSEWAGSTAVSGAGPLSPAAGLSLEAADAPSSCLRSSPSRSSASPAGRGLERCLCTSMIMREPSCEEAHA